MGPGQGAPVPGVIARAVRARRLELHLSVEEAAERARIHLTSWRLIEHGTLNPSPLMIRAICRVLDWTPATIENLLHGDLSVDGEGGVVVDLARWPGEEGAGSQAVADVAPVLDVAGLTPEQLSEVQAFIDDLREIDGSD